MSDPAPAAAPAAPAPDPKAAAPDPAPAAAPAAPAAAATDPKAAPAAGSAPAAAGAAPAADPAPAPSKGVWPEDWITRMAKGNEDVAKQLKRYASPEAFADAHVNLRRKMDSGELKSVLPKDAKPEDVAAWRKEHGIPEKPDAYDLAGVEIPEGDKPFVSAVIAKMHGANATPEAVRTAVQAYYEENQRLVQERLAKDDEESQAGIDALNQEWGGTYRRNMNLVKGILSKFPESVRAAIEQARDADGKLLFNQPDVMRGFLALALESNPAGIVVPAAGGDIGKTALEEYRDIQTYMREKRADYNKDTAKQTRFRELIAYLQQNEMIDANGKEIVARRKAA